MIQAMLVEYRCLSVNLKTEKENKIKKLKDEKENEIKKLKYEIKKLKLQLANWSIQSNGDDDNDNNDDNDDNDKK